MTDRTLIDDLEAILHIPLVPDQVRRIGFQHPDFRMFSYILRDILRNLALPEKRRSMIRPTLLRPDLQWMFTVPTNSYEHLQDVNRSNLSAVIKRSLLYSDSVALDLTPIIRPLQMIARPFWPNDGLDLTETQWLRAIEIKLIEIAEMADLVRHRLIIPFAGDLVSKQGPIGSQIDPMFRNKNEAAIYVDRLKAEVKSFSCEDVRRPFYSAFVMEVPSINPNAVDWNDILSLRRDEEVFQEWRDLVHGILEELYKRRDDFTDIDAEFKTVAADRFRAWSERLSVQRMRRSALDAFFEGGKEVGFEWLGGALARAAVLAWMGAPATAVAAAAAVDAVAHAGRPLLSMLSEVWRATSLHEERVSLEHHILALPIGT